MHNHQRLIIVFILGLLFGLIATLSASAHQEPDQVSGQSDKPTQTQQTKNDEPVAITEKSKPADSTVVKTLASDQFGNFRFPIINNKGEIAFLALFPSPQKKFGAGQSIFVRSVDGTWKVVYEGEKPTNMQEAIHSFSVPAFNDNGDLTFIASFGAEEKQSGVELDPNDPIAHGPIIKNMGLFIRTANGLKKLVKLGEEVPNMPSIFSGISNASTNSKGTTAFIGTYSDPDGRGLFMIEDGKLRLVARSGQKIGSGEEATFSEHYYPTAINDRNEVAFLARVGDKSGIFVARPSGIEMIAFGGKPSPVKEANYLGFGNRTPAINQKGEVSFVGFFDGPEAGRGLFFKGAGAVKLVARSGETIPGTTYNFTDFLSPAVNSRGDIAFIGLFGGRNRGIFVKTAKGIEPIAVSDQPIPGGGKDEVFNNFTQPSINDRGEVVFYAQFKTPTTGVDIGVFMRDQKGILKMLIKRGDKMPK